MNNTNQLKQVKSNKYINPLTVGYTFFFIISFFVFLVAKQIMKTGFGADAKIALPISALIGSVLLYLFEKKYVFKSLNKNKIQKQIPMLIFRIAVSFGFYKILGFLLTDLMKADETIAFVISTALIYLFSYFFDSVVLFDSRLDWSNAPATRLYNTFYENRYIVLSGAMASLIISVTYIIFNIFPYGDISVLKMDLYHQYGPLMMEFFDRVIEHKSFLYSWESGGGSSFLGNYFNYLSSPLSFLIFLFDRNQIGDSISTIVAIKAVLSAVAFTYYIKKSQNSHSVGSASFGVFYAFSAYFFAYFWNIMWLDGMIFIPLIALGIEKIINDAKSKTYLISLALLFYCNYYMGYMACIFSVVYFLIYYFSKYDMFSNRSTLDENSNGLKAILNNRFLGSGLQFALYSLLAGALCAFFLLPIYNILQNSSATSGTFPNEMKGYFDLLNLFTSHLAGLEATIRSSGDDVLPNIYCGILPLLLMPLYLINRKISIKEKASYIIMLVFFVFSFDNNCADYIWHGFHMPNDLPFRYSFMYVFIFLTMAYKAFLRIKDIEYKDIMTVGLIEVGIVILLQKYQTNKMTSFTIYLSIALIIIWTCMLLIIREKKASKTFLSFALICLVFSESLICGCTAYKFSVPQTPYTDNLPTYKQATKYLDDNDDGFYRAELTDLKTRMDPCIYGYNGMSVFSSMAYENYSQCQYSLGLYGNRINSYTYNPQTPVYNMMYGLKYLIKAKSTQDLSPIYFKHIYTTQDSKETEIYENRYFLPIGFEVSEEVKNWDNSEGNPFDVQEDLIDKAAGVSNVFVPVKYTGTQTISSVCEDITENGIYPIATTGSGSIDVTFEAQTDSNVYIYIKSDAIKNVNYYWDKGEESANQNIEQPYIYDLGYHKAGEQIKASLDLAGSDEGGASLNIYAYSIDNDVLQSAYDTLKECQFDVTKHSDTKLEGTINAGYNGYIYTSIPYDSGWKVYVDSQQVTPEALGKGRKEMSDTDTCQLIIPITQGEHTIKLKYSPNGIWQGALISAGALVVLIVIEMIERKRKN